jgi:protein SCO1
MKTNKFLFAAIILGAFALAMAGVYVVKKNQFAQADFTLTSPNGPVKLSSLRGELVILYFGFLSCPDACPTTLTRIAQALKKLPPAKADKVRPVFVNLDPERDSIQRLKEYADFFHPRILPLTSDIENLKKVTHHFGAAFQKIQLPSAMDYTIDHTTDLVFVRPNGEVHSTLKETATTDDIVAKINEIL